MRPHAYRGRMFAVAHSATVVGVDAVPIKVEAFVSSGLPSFTVVGLPGAAVQESRERVRAALKQLGFPLPPSRIVINMAPADVRKEGPSFDLPIALAVLAADRRIPLNALADVLAFGELALDGSLRPVRGAVSIALLAAGAKHTTLLGPQDNAPELGLLHQVEAYAPATLDQAVNHLTGRVRLTRVQRSTPVQAEGTHLDLADVRGQAMAKRALEVAAAGRHNLLLTGPPGAGKTMLALRLPDILPPLLDTEAVEVCRVHSSAGLASAIGANGLPRKPLLRQPHHTASEAGILGGGAHPRPGEISLAHNGVLFLDELPEFRRSVLEALRQPLEEGHVTISRASAAVRLPARFQLIAAQNPCPCGGAGSDCACQPNQVTAYRRRVSMPLLDRIDVRLAVPRLTTEELLDSRPGEPSSLVAGRVAAARTRMLERQGVCNAYLRGKALQRHALPKGQGQRLLEDVTTRHRLSGRGLDRLLRLARTVADLDGCEAVELQHVAEAAAYREETR